MYPQNENDKDIDMSVEPMFEDNKKMLLVNFQIAQSSDADLEETFQKGSYAGVWLSQELARDLDHVLAPV